MKRILFFLMASTFLVLGGCATEETQEIELKGFKRACEKNTIEAYEEFLDEHPSGIYAEQVRSKTYTIETSAWNTACEANTFESYIRFHREYRKARSDELRQRLLSLATKVQPVTDENNLVGHTPQSWTYGVFHGNVFEGHNITLVFGNSPFTKSQSSDSSQGTKMVGMLGAPGSK